MDENQKNGRVEDDALDEKMFDLTKGETLFFGGLLIIILLLYIPLLFVGVSYFYNTFGKQYGVSLVYIAFGIFSLIASLVLFGFLKSSGVAKTPQYQFGGAAALFVVTLGFLVWRLPDSDSQIAFKGIVYLNQKVQPEAKIVLQEAEISRNTNEFGVFEMVLDESDFHANYTLVVTYEELQKEFVINHEDLKTILKLYLEEQQKPSNSSRVSAPQEYWKVVLIVPSDMDGAAVTVGSKPANIVSQIPTEITILVEKANTIHRIAVIKNSHKCSIESLILQDVELYPCRS